MSLEFGQVWKDELDFTVMWICETWSGPVAVLLDKGRRARLEKPGDLVHLQRRWFDLARRIE